MHQDPDSEQYFIKGAGPSLFSVAQLLHATPNWRPTSASLLAWYKRSRIGGPIYGAGNSSSEQIIVVKFLLDQRLSTISQHQWASKLIGFDFTVEFKPGRANIVADSLSRRHADDPMACSALSIPRFSVFDDIRHAVATDPSLESIRQKAMEGVDDWSSVDGLLLHKGRVFVPDTSPLASSIVATIHDNGHEGIQKTLQRLRADFFIPRDRLKVREHVLVCLVCQQNKVA